MSLKLNGLLLGIALIGWIYSIVTLIFESRQKWRKTANPENINQLI